MSQQPAIDRDLLARVGQQNTQSTGASLSTLMSGPSVLHKESDRARFVQLLLFIVLVIAGFVLVFTIVLPRMMGWVPGEVSNQSMTPAYNQGDEIFFRKVNNSDLSSIKVGSVIVVQPDENKLQYMITRVAEVREEGTKITYVTRHDASTEPDPDIVTADMVRGVAMYHLPWVGRVLSDLSETARSLLLIFASMGLLALAGWFIATAQLNARHPYFQARRARLKAAAAAGRLEADRRRFKISQG